MEHTPANNAEKVRFQIRQQLSKLGQTPFKLVEFVDNSAETYFIPASVLNELRRMCVENLLDVRRSKFKSDDMLHPSATAVDYIWDIFKKTYIDASCHERIMLTDKLNKALAHRFEHTPSATEKAKFDEYVDSLRKQLDSLL